MITINFWSDFACPFCYIAEQRLKNIVKDLGIEDQVRYKMHSYELNPEAPTDFEAPTVELMAQKYGMPIEKAEQRIQLINHLAEEEGITGFDDGKTQVVNTMDAHCLVKYVQMKQDDKLTDQVIERLFKAFFVDFENVADHQVLLSIAEEVGLDKQEVQEMLISGQYKVLVQQDEIELVSAGVNSVPFFIIGNKGISGAQPRSVFEEAIQEALENTDTPFTSSTDKGMNCGPEGCSLS